MKAQTVLHIGLLCGGLALSFGGLWGFFRWPDEWLWRGSLPLTGVSLLLSLVADVARNEEGPALPEIVVATALLPVSLVIGAAFVHTTSPTSPVAWVAVVGALFALGVVAHLFERPRRAR